MVWRDHRVGGQKVLCGAAELELALAGASLALENANIQLQQVVWAQPIISGEAGVEVKLALRPESDGGVCFELRTPSGEVHAHGKAEITEGFAEEVLDLKAIQSRCSQTVSPEELYHGFADRGLEYGPGFRVIREIGFGIGEAWSLLQVPEGWASETYRLHPALLDGALQSLAALGAKGTELELPFVVDEVQCGGALPNRCYSYGRAEAGEGGTRRYEVKLLGEQGEVLARLGGLTVRRAERSAGELLFYRPVWVPDPLRGGLPLFDGPVLLLDDNPELAKALEGRGVATVQVVAGEATRRPKV